MTGARVPPHDLAAERAVLCAFLLDNQAIDTARVLLKAEDFYHAGYQVVAQSAFRMREGGDEVDVVTLRDRLGGGLDQWGGRELLDSLAGAMPSAANAEHYARIVRRHSMVRAGLRYCRRGETLLHECNGNVSEVLAGLTEDLRIIREDVPGIVKGEVYDGEQLLALELGDRDHLVGSVLGQGETFIFTGQDKLGKSMAVLGLACELAREAPEDMLQGSEWLGMPVFGPRKTLYFVGEGGLRGYQERFGVLTRDHSPEERRRVKSWFSGPDALHLDRAEDARMALEMIQDHGAHLVVFDSFANFHGLEENSTADMSLIGSRIKWLRDESGATVSCIHHTRKPGIGSNAGSGREMRGSSVIAADVDGYVVMAHNDPTDEQDRGVRWTWWLRYEEAPDVIISELNRASLRFEVRAQGLAGRPTTHGKCLPELLVYLSANGPSTYAQIKEDTGIPERTMRSWYKRFPDQLQIDPRASKADPITYSVRAPGERE